MRPRWPPREAQRAHVDEQFERDTGIAVLRGNLAPDGAIIKPSAAWTLPAAGASAYVKLYVDHALQANDGADLDFLVGRSGAAVPRDN